jgi:tetratricopeptide (TPR) repeat protein
MAKRRNRASHASEPSRPGNAKALSRRAWFIAVLAVLSVAGVTWWIADHAGTKSTSVSQQSSPVATATVILEDEKTVFAQYAGSASCRECHEEAYEQWQKSNHGLAERTVSGSQDRAAFDPPRSFPHGTQVSEARWADGTAQVTSTGLSGRPEKHTIARVIGNDPLRQYLVPFPGGRLQTLEASYDPHSNEWFNVYGQEDRRPGEWGHWTGRGMNWNFMCASCHNTRLRKNYDEATDSFHTTMAEMSVGCEACHGPLKAHNEWQNQWGKTDRKDPTLRKHSRTAVVDTCGFCHARRSDLTGDFKPGDSFSDHFDLTLVDYSERYYADGQIRDEDYEYGSFLSSRMHQRGVVCMDCHNAHSAKTTLPGNWLCMRCHNGNETNAPVINPVRHSFHKVFGHDTNGVLTNTDLMSYKPRQIAETGGECVNCHMPQTTYMQRHGRHDHGFTIPDPLLTKKFNIPNACNRCHKDKSTDWALEFTEKWYGEKMNRPSRTRAEWIALAQQGDTTARAGLLEVLAREESPYWQASLLGMLDPWASRPEVSAAILQRLEHTNALVRGAAVHALEPTVQAPEIGEALRKRLDDPALNVRLAAAWALRASLDPQSRAGRELRHLLDSNGDQPSDQMRKGDYFLARNDPQTALGHFQKAVLWDPYSGPFRQRAAVALSALNRPREAVETLREGCRLNTNDAELRFQLALACNEAGDLSEAIKELESTVKINPRHASAWYNLGLAQSSAGQPEAAIESLLRGETAEPLDARIPYARATVLARIGKNREAAVAARRALEIEPSYSDARQLLQQLGE